MAIHFQHAIKVPQSPEEVFAVLDEVTLTPKWLERCTGIEAVTPGPIGVGTKLRYSFREGGRIGVMEGEVTERTPNEHLMYRYQDRMMDVAVDFRMTPTGEGTHLVHTIDIAPKTLVGKLFSPLIRLALPKQTIKAMETLRGLLAARG